MGDFEDENERVLFVFVCLLFPVWCSSPVGLGERRGVGKRRREKKSLEMLEDGQPLSQSSLEVSCENVLVTSSKFMLEILEHINIHLP